MSELSPISCDLRNLIPETTQVLILNQEIKTLSEYMNIQNATKSKGTLYAYLRWWIYN